jgi:dephospho-CoA kinase
MKVLITGAPGTGKSTISKALNSRGIHSIDFSDISGLCFWRDRKTGEKIEYSPVNDIKWFEDKERICDKTKLQEVVDQYDDIVVTGVARDNQLEYLDLFDKVLLLQCRPETFVQRMIEREKPYGKTQAERDMVVEWQKKLDPQYIAHGAISINAEGTAEEVLERILPELR